MFRPFDPLDEIPSFLTVILGLLIQALVFWVEPVLLSESLFLTVEASTLCVHV